MGHIDTVLLLASLTAVLAIRVQLLLQTDFPINDGALFLAFVEAIARTFPSLPVTVDFNGAAIPFAYPPLAFWLGAAGARLGLSPLAIVHLAPILMNIGYVLLFALLLLRTGHSRLFTALAVLVFGTTFRSYEWLVMGGGLSRGLGSLFLLATLLALLPSGLWRERGWSWPRLVAGGLGIGITMVSHLEWGLLCTFSALVCLALARRRAADWLVGAVVLGATSLAVYLPWFAWAMQVHGLEPFRAASATAAWRWTAIPEGARMVMRNAGPMLPFVLLGAVLVRRGRDFFWVLFLLASLLLIPRSGETPLVLALGVLAAAGLKGTVAAAARWRGRWGRTAAIALVAIGIALTALRAGSTFRRDENFVTLPPEVRTARGWVAEHQRGGRFAVLREAPWYYNGPAEWFPLLTGAVSTTTMQGREWLPGGDFALRYAAVYQLEEAATCAELLDGLAALPRSDFAWVEGIRLQGRAELLLSWTRPKALTERLSTGWQRLRGEAPPDPRQGAAGALRGSGTAGGCLDDAGWREVHANPRVRIFQPPR
ncbi:MAG: hypothetical protein KY444_06150 [Gemmatimonadetes bacterium]|nr:hypothetical protein [Gemmatimonadota bacterium]